MAKVITYRTKNREMMLAYLKANKDRTVYVSDIHDYMKEQGVNVNITTIYRFLDKLQEEHRILKYAVEKGESAGFQYVGEGHSCEAHLHIKCSECGRVVHLDCGFMDEIRSHLEQYHHFQLQCSGSSLFGICDECRQKEKKPDVDKKS
ncbi:MAG: transcriptional repressor [Lachnospiraceae bacterium]|nr:transcriptional repressor [Lachnospiraceae bacterium]